MADNERCLAHMPPHGSGNIGGILLSVRRGYRHHFRAHSQSRGGRLRGLHCPTQLRCYDGGWVRVLDDRRQCSGAALSILCKWRIIWRLRRLFGMSNQQHNCRGSIGLSSLPQRRSGNSGQHQDEGQPCEPQYIENRRRRTIGTPLGVSPTISCVAPGGNEPSALGRAAWPFATKVWTKCLVASSCGTMTSSLLSGALGLRRVFAMTGPFLPGCLDCDNVLSVTTG
jgi:hypothetical protein